jgi:hypothetical protein
MQKQAIEANGTIDAPLLAGAKAIERARVAAVSAAGATSRVVRKHPLILMGLAAGGGIVLGAFGHWLLTPARETPGEVS